MTIRRMLATSLLVAASALPLSCASNGQEAASPAAETTTSVKEWDQAHVTDLARQLADVSREADRIMRSRNLGDQQRRDFFRMREIVRRVRNETSRLALLLEGGAGHDETLPVFETLGMHVRDAKEVLGRLFTTQDLNQQFDKARELLNELAPYYDYDAQPIQPVRR